MNEKIDARTSPRASLEHLKNQAKSLLKLARDQNPHALARLRRARALPEKSGAATPPFKLADAQLAIARENGSASWTELRDALARQPAPASAPPASDALSILGLNQIWLDCTDLDATEKFYGGVLGLEKTGQVPGMMVFFDCQGTSLLLGKRDPVRPNSILYFRLEDSVAALQSAYNRLKQAGARVGDSPHCIAKNWNGRDSWLAFFHDPSGNQLAFKVDVPTG
jgi:catechol 2,3-dioxygenase-like lactoylglutathione lyase family enzyme